MCDQVPGLFLIFTLPILYLNSAISPLEPITSSLEDGTLTLGASLWRVIYTSSNSSGFLRLINIFYHILPPNNIALSNPRPLYEYI